MVWTEITRRQHRRDGLRYDFNIHLRAIVEAALGPAAIEVQQALDERYKADDLEGRGRLRNIKKAHDRWTNGQQNSGQ